MKILMIDDDREDIEIFTSFLEVFDNSIVLETAFDGREGLQKITRDAFQPDFIFLDLNMPRYDGFYFLREIRQLPDKKVIPVIVFTTSSHQTDVERSRKMGATHFITKPADYSSMKDIVGALFSDNPDALKNIAVY